jgi:RNA polymerase sigma factor (TIGR02999 family)
MTPPITPLLAALGGGDAAARDRALAAVYDELRRLAHAYFRRERRGHTLQTTAIVHEAYVQLVGQRAVQWQSRAHFFGIAAHLIRRILVEHARKRGAHKRGGHAVRVTLDADLAVAPVQDVSIVAVDEALRALAALDEQQARIVELRVFGGLTVEEAADALGISPRTVKRDWRMAKAWLQRALGAA